MVKFIPATWGDLDDCSDHCGCLFWRAIAGIQERKSITFKNLLMKNYIIQFLLELDNVPASLPGYNGWEDEIK